MNTKSIINQLLNSDEPSIRWKTRVNVLGESPDSPKIKKLQLEIKNSPRVKALLAHKNSKGKIISPRSVYDKWQGAHWILASLADIGYPAGDKSLFTARDQILDCWLSDYYYKEFEVQSKEKSYLKAGVPVMNGRYRRCGSQQGNALYALLKLGLDTERIDNLVERLLHWQWPDGGWNCDRNPSADSSSFMETLLPFRGLALYAKLRKNKKAKAAAKRASEVFLSRKMFKRISDGRVIHNEFISLHYPLYWHYDILGGLKVMAEAGFIKDRRCHDALDLLEQKMLPSGGWPAEKRYYKVSKSFKLASDYADWGGTSKKKMNKWVTVDALYMLKEAGRIKV